jgi:hypothetical protein
MPIILFLSGFKGCLSPLQVYGTIIHIDIKDEKIWIQRHNTEINLADRLVESGVPKENIVIGLYSPFMRQFSGYAVG